MKDRRPGIRAWALGPTAASSASFITCGGGVEGQKGHQQLRVQQNEAVNKCSLQAEPRGQTP